jgi:hypothetical protein
MELIRVVLPLKYWVRSMSCILENVNESEVPMALLVSIFDTPTYTWIMELTGTFHATKFVAPLYRFVLSKPEIYVP